MTKSPVDVIDARKEHVVKEGGTEQSTAYGKTCPDCPEAD